MKIMVSACLLGDNVKYNGKNNFRDDLKKFLDNYEVIKVCPEVLGGLTIPRSPSEIKNGNVINSDGIDVTENYQKGALRTLDIVKKNNIKVAILKMHSPSCGSGMIYDGSFTHTLSNGDGITVRMLKKNGVIILNEENYKEYKW